MCRACAEPRWQGACARPAVGEGRAAYFFSPSSSSISAIAPMADRVIEIKNGKCVRQRMNEHPMPVEKIEW